LGNGTHHNRIFKVNQFIVSTYEHNVQEEFYIFYFFDVLQESQFLHKVMFDFSLLAPKILQILFILFVSLNVFVLALNI